MKKETFVKIMAALEYSKVKACEFEDELEILLRKHRPEQLDFISNMGVLIEDWKLFDDLTAAISEEFKYDNSLDDICWWVYEAEFGKKFNRMFYHNKPIDISTAENFYDTLMFFTTGDESYLHFIEDGEEGKDDERYPSYDFKTLLKEICENQEK